MKPSWSTLRSESAFPTHPTSQGMNWCGCKTSWKWWEANNSDHASMLLGSVVAVETVDEIYKIFRQHSCCSKHRANSCLHSWKWRLSSQQQKSTWIDETSRKLTLATPKRVPTLAHSFTRHIAWQNQHTTCLAIGWKWQQLDPILWRCIVTKIFHVASPRTMTCIIFVRHGCIRLIAIPSGILGVDLLLVTLENISVQTGEKLHSNHVFYWNLIRSKHKRGHFQTILGVTGTPQQQDSNHVFHTMEHLLYADWIAMTGYLHHVLAFRL